ncbi:hypothetical protein LCI18_012025 [Fusarium solani-melongenae]|uniref:Uncharacterized protein n=1 Tax=Fusarium solani subsp. cucurbitae TaxID=2747967 RepID=A0ACD3ZIM2_FUSSC|nr:hypothetical protein LCI18_012025 [Fusarium solani-melongenae]
MHQISAQMAKTRRSCERCRLQKKKCSAEKPTCSLCCRLNEPCIYLPRSQQNGNPERRSVSRRAQIARCQRVDQETARHNATSDPLHVEAPQESRFPSASSHEITEPSSALTPRAQPNQVRSCQPDLTWSTTKPEPPEDSLDFFIDAYRDNLYFQPLPLFGLVGLKAKLISAPRFLRWGFLALVLKFTTHPFYDGKMKQATEFYKASCRSVVMELSSEGTVKLDVLRALCILALLDVLDGNFAQAWMTIGTASRLQALRLLYVEEDDTTEDHDSNSSRCYWSIFMLEKTFSPNFCLLAQNTHAPTYPPSPPPPLLSRPVVLDESCQDYGINACCLQAVSIWGDVVSYLEGIRLGKAEQPWMPSSEHSQLIMKLHELELNLAHQHLLRKVSFQGRQPAELHHEQEYWAPWVLMQFISHGAHAALHNPFIQLVALRKPKPLSQPLSFLQRSVDQSLFHSAWVARLLRVCDTIPFQVRDPIVGQLVAATATIPWLFQFARDETISNKAKDDFREYDEALGRFSEKWPHIARKRHILRYLQSFTRQRLSEMAGDGATVKFPPQLVWELLIPRPLNGVFGDHGGFNPTSLPSLSGDETLQIITSYVHPSQEDNRELYPSQTIIEGDDSRRPVEWLNDSIMNEFLSDLALTDFTWLPFCSPEGT